MFLIRVKCLFFLEKTCFRKIEKKINIWQNNLFYKCPWVKANVKMVPYYQAVLCTLAFLLLFKSLFTVYKKVCFIFISFYVYLISFLIFL